MMMCGGGEALATSPAAATGAGVILPVAGVATASLGAAITTHGIAVGLNTVFNIMSEDANPESSKSSMSATSNVPANIDVDRASQLNPQRKTHILDGDGPNSGGHGPGRGIGGKSEFPLRWSDEQTIERIKDVVKDSNSKWTQRTGPPGATHTRNGDPVKWMVEGTRDGVDIRVIVEPVGEGTITAFPTNIPLNT